MSRSTDVETSEDEARNLAGLRAMIKAGLDDADAGRVLSLAEVKRALKRRRT